MVSLTIYRAATVVVPSVAAVFITYPYLRTAYGALGIGILVALAANWTLKDPLF